MVETIRKGEMFIGVLRDKVGRVRGVGPRHPWQLRGPWMQDGFEVYFVTSFLLQADRAPTDSGSSFLRVPHNAKD
jgi:hypothetical protein